uniref:Glutaredoxin-2, mitochondrial n=3 Tax=Caniformia TaxID=379584 RepID=A0A8P0TF25_CANLF
MTPPVRVFLSDVFLLVSPGCGPRSPALLPRAREPLWASLSPAQPGEGSAQASRPAGGASAAVEAHVRRPRPASPRPPAGTRGPAQPPPRSLHTPPAGHNPPATPPSRPGTPPSPRPPRPLPTPPPPARHSPLPAPCTTHPGPPRPPRPLPPGPAPPPPRSLHTPRPATPPRHAPLPARTRPPPAPPAQPPSPLPPARHPPPMPGGRARLRGGDRRRLGQPRGAGRAGEGRGGAGPAPVGAGAGAGPGRGWRSRVLPGRGRRTLRPCPGSARRCGRRGRMGNSTSSSASAPAPVNQIQETISDNCVVIFSKTSCSYCTMAKKLFHDMNVKYKVVELDMLEYGSQFQDALYKMTGERTVPRIFINGTFIGGATDTHRLHKEGKLLPLVHQCYLKKSKRKEF